jgi:hypothetical protein
MLDLSQYNIPTNTILREALRKKGFNATVVRTQSCACLWELKDMSRKLDVLKSKATDPVTVSSAYPTHVRVMYVASIIQCPSLMGLPD